MLTAAPPAELLVANRMLRTTLAGLIRSYGSIQLIERSQLAVALLDDRGRVVLGRGGLHIGNLEALAQSCLATFGELQPGDVAITNDPYSGGTRVTDHFGIAPGLAGGERLGLAVVTAPFFDVGGKRLGNDVPEAPDLFAEGVRTTPIRIRRGGVVDQDVLRLLRLNSRVPALVGADVEALLATVTILTGHAAGLLVGELPAALPAASRAVVESALVGLASPGPARTAPVPRAADGTVIQIALSVADGKLAVDFSGTSGQVPSHHNATLPTTVSAVVRAVADQLGCLPNSGVSEALQVKGPPQSILSCVASAAVGGGVHGTCAVVYALVRECLGAGGNGSPGERS